jgi:hypothetical protein
MILSARFIPPLSAGVDMPTFDFTLAAGTEGANYGSFPYGNSYGKTMVRIKAEKFDPRALNLHFTATKRK